MQHMKPHTLPHLSPYESTGSLKSISWWSHSPEGRLESANLVDLGYYHDIYVVLYYVGLFYYFPFAPSPKAHLNSQNASWTSIICNVDVFL